MNKKYQNLGKVPVVGLTWRLGESLAARKGWIVTRQQPSNLPMAGGVRA